MFVKSQLHVVVLGSVLESTSARGRGGRDLHTYRCAGLLHGSDVSASLKYRLVGPPYPDGTVLAVQGSFAFRSSCIHIGALKIQHLGSVGSDVNFRWPIRVHIDGFVQDFVKVTIVNGLKTMVFMCGVHGPAPSVFRCTLEHAERCWSRLPVIYDQHRVTMVGDVTGHSDGFVDIRILSFTFFPYPVDIVTTDVFFEPDRAVEELATEIVGISDAVSATPSAVASLSSISTSPSVPSTPRSKTVTVPAARAQVTATILPISSLSPMTRPITVVPVSKSQPTPRGHTAPHAPGTALAAPASVTKKDESGYPHERGPKVSFTNALQFSGVDGSDDRGADDKSSLVPLASPISLSAGNQTAASTAMPVACLLDSSDFVGTFNSLRFDDLLAAFQRGPDSDGAHSGAFVGDEQAMSVPQPTAAETSGAPKDGHVPASAQARTGVSDDGNATQISPLPGNQQHATITSARDNSTPMDIDDADIDNDSLFNEPLEAADPATREASSRAPTLGQLGAPTDSIAPDSKVVDSGPMMPDREMQLPVPSGVAPAARVVSLGAPDWEALSSALNAWSADFEPLGAGQFPQFKDDDLFYSSADNEL